MAPVSRFIARYPNSFFWSCFLLLNGVLFLPIYFFYSRDASFWPIVSPFEGDFSALLQTLFLERENLDIFRLNLELTLLVALWLFVRGVRNRAFLALGFVLYLLQLTYAVYEGFIRSYYLLDPVLFNDYFLISDGARFTLRSLNLTPAQLLFGVMALGAGAAVLFGLNHALFGGIDPDRLSRGTRWGVVGLLGIGVLPAAALHLDLSAPEMAISSFSAKLSHNLSLSREARADADRFDAERIAPFYTFTDAALERRPDIYLIFVESYGSVLYERQDFRYMYELSLKVLENQLDLHGWSATSNRSEATTWGGGSWISYTSAMTGMRLDSHAEYLTLFNQYQNQPFPHLFNYLRGQGYRSYRLSSNSDQIDDLSWERYKNFYGVDEWLRFNDLEYDGPLYGWGPAPPDQYAIHYANELMNRDPEPPHVFFYITQNSHYPWQPLPELAGDWRTAADAPAPEVVPAGSLSHPDLRRAYLESIQYELSMLTDFIVQEGDEDDLFILIGDHQPARVARYADGWDTPIHIISRDPALVAAFEPYGFRPGLGTGDSEATLHHEGFYSLFVRVLLQQYGADPARLPEYHPNGVPFE